MIERAWVFDAQSHPNNPELSAFGLLVAWGLSSCGSWALECRLSSCGAWACLLRGMWDLPGPGLEPVSPALAGGLLTTAPPGKSLDSFIWEKNKLLSCLSHSCFAVCSFALFYHLQAHLTMRITRGSLSFSQNMVLLPPGLSVLSVPSAHGTHLFLFSSPSAMRISAFAVYPCQGPSPSLGGLF